MLGIIILDVIMLSVVILSIMAPPIFPTKARNNEKPLSK
jgi:hypothetical protein